MKRCLAYITKIILPDYYSLLYTVYMPFPVKEGGILHEILTYKNVYICNVSMPPSHPLKCFV